MAGQDQGGQERRHHPSGHQVAAVTASSTNECRADPPLAGGRPALRRRSGRARRRSRRRARRAPCHPRAERRREDDAVQPRGRRLPALGWDDRGDGPGRHAPARPCAAGARARPHVPEDQALSRPLRRGQHLSRDPRARRRPTARVHAQAGQGRPRARARGSRARAARRQDRHVRPRPLPRRAAPARGRAWRAPSSPG